MNIVITFEGATLEAVTDEIIQWAQETTGLDAAELAEAAVELTAEGPAPPDMIEIVPAPTALVVPADVTPPVVVPLPLALPVAVAPEPVVVPLRPERPVGMTDATPVVVTEDVGPGPRYDPALVAGSSYIAPDVDVVTPDPVAPIAVAPAPIAVAPAPVAELDATGMPWDARIHSDKPTLKKDGHWRAKRGLATKPGGPELIASVEAELRGGAPVAAPVAPALPPPALPAEPPAPTVEGADNAVAIELCTSILVHVSSMANGLVLMEQLKPEINAIMAQHGCPGGVPDLLEHPEQVPSIITHLRALAERWGVPSA